MAASGVALLRDRSLHQTVTAAARDRVTRRFCADRVVPMYERCYTRALPTDRRSVPQS
jgi:hypothetical protein